MVALLMIGFMSMRRGSISGDSVSIILVALTRLQSGKHENADIVSDLLNKRTLRKQ